MHPVGADRGGARPAYQDGLCAVPHVGPVLVAHVGEDDGVADNGWSYLMFVIVMVMPPG